MQSNAFKTLILAILAACVWSGAARADWEFIGGEEATVHTARVCKGADEVLCLELGCTLGDPLAFRLTSQNMAGMVAAAQLDTLLFVGSQLAGSLDFSQSGLESFHAPLEETHLRGIQRLKAGIRAQLHVWYSGDAAPEVHNFTLIGSQNAITAVEQFCPQPDFAARELERRTLPDPATKILGDMREACTVLDGQLTVGEDFDVAIDIDGKPPLDLRVNHGAMVCDSTPDMVCGPAGCLTSFWLGLDNGQYRRVFLDAIQDAALTGQPGVLTLSLKGSRCGDGDDAGPCGRAYELDGFELKPRQ
ncbi:hypothetical protein [Antarctobacter heliothermus]|uniref:Uncharacterized protein n=1 Tax=Antarctobacter heliothermus TaxID=74033 RepID=A0A239KZ84_9RHOB|nr:hypothetical protein [Antarctobacter heliothermus]SNT22789.1 hypothetical protein SAMN04488078_10747 [Antarctobacter heliothermus]